MQDSQTAHQTCLINEEYGDGDDDSEIDDENDSDEVQFLKRQKKEAATKRLVQNRTQTVGLVNGRWTVLPRNYEFPKGMTMEHLINSWLLSDTQTRIPPLCTLNPSQLTEKQQRVYRKMRATMFLVKYHGKEKQTWRGDSPSNWNIVTTRTLWESIKDGFRQQYFSIQRKANGTSGGGQQTKRKEKNRQKAITWSSIYNNCSSAGIFKQLRETNEIDST